jgi:hypothetical protein
MMGQLVGLARRPAVLVLISTAVVVAGLGLAAFQPWKLWVDATVNEAVPTSPATPLAAPDRACRQPAIQARRRPTAAAR